jgi:hypothetical protein
MRQIALLFFAMIFANSCTFRKSNSDAKLNFKLPDKTKGFAARKLMPKTAQSLSGTNLGSSLWGLQAQLQIEEADCYAVYIQSADLEAGSCMAADSSSVVAVSRLYGLFSAGQSVSIEVPSGNGRTVGIFALMSQDGTCADSTHNSFDPRKYSKPVFVGSATQNLRAGDNKLYVDISMTNSIPMESCTGPAFNQLANAKWPSCQAEASGVSYQNGEIKISGYCLGNAESVSLIDTSSSQKSALNLIEKNNNELRLRPAAGAMSITAKTLYRLLLSTAQGALTEVPFNLTLENTFTFPELKDSTGNVIGELINPGGNYYGNNLLNVYNSAGELISYFAQDAGGAWFSSKLFLVPNFMIVPETLGTVSSRQAARNGITFQTNNYYWFSGANCTGDIIIPTNYSGGGTTKLRGNIVVQPTNCTQDTANNNQWTCAGYDYFRMSGEAILHTNESTTYGSTFNLNWGPALQSGSFSYCYNNTDINTTSGSTNFFRFSESQKVPFGTGDIQTTLINAKINLR